MTQKHLELIRKMQLPPKVKKWVENQPSMEIAWERCNDPWILFNLTKSYLAESINDSSGLDTFMRVKKSVMDIAEEKLRRYIDKSENFSKMVGKALMCVGLIRYANNFSGEIFPARIHLKSGLFREYLQEVAVDPAPIITESREMVLAARKLVLWYYGYVRFDLLFDEKFLDFGFTKPYQVPKKDLAELVRIYLPTDMMMKRAFKDFQ